MLDAAKAMKLSSKDLLKLEIIDEIIPEPIGGAHRDENLILENVKISITKNLNNFKRMSPDEILSQRKNKFLKIGRNKSFINNDEDLTSLKFKDNLINKIFQSKKLFSAIVGVLIIFFISIILFL